MAAPPAEQLEEYVQHLKEWICKEPHLPNIQDEDWLATFLHRNKYRLEKTKLKLDGYYSLRTKYPQVLKNRDPTSPEIVQAGTVMRQCISDRLTKDGDLMLFCQMAPDPEFYDVTAALKRLFMIMDLIYLEKDNYCSVIVVIDCRHSSYKYFPLELPMMKIAAEVHRNGFSGRVRALHLINAPSYLDKVLSLLRGLLPEKYNERFFVHSVVTSFREMVDENVLCSNFGGNGPSFSQYDEYTKKLLEKHREWFLAQNDVCSDESLRRKNENQSEEIRGFFRMLQVD